jgi:hypothetical protein
MLDSPLVLVLIGEWIVIDRGSLQGDRRLLWLASVLAVAIPFGAMTAAKSGGEANSVLPAILPLMAFCILRLPRFIGHLEDADAGVRPRLMLGVFLAVSMLMTAFPHLTRQNSLFITASPRDRAYWKVVSLARDLSGTVVCPEDPTIPVYAKFYAGRNIFSEYDAHVVDEKWPVTPPRTVRSEIRDADYVIDVSEFFQDLVDGKLLQDLGFERVDVTSLDPACYQIWRRKQLRMGGALAAPRS